MNTRVATVTIQTENGPVLINESDFDAEKHELAEPAAPVKDAEPAAPVKDAEPAAPVKMLVTKEGRKHFVVGEDGKGIEAEGIDAKGYASDADAWAAIMALNA